MPEFPEIPGVHELTSEADEERRERFSRIVAIGIVMTTLFAATTAYLQAVADHRYDEARTAATRLATDALAERNRIAPAVQMLVERYDLAEDQRGHAALAEQRTLLGSDASGERAAERERWLIAARQTERNTRDLARAYRLRPVRLTAPDGPAQDRFFPVSFVAGGRGPVYRLEAQRDAEDEMAEKSAHQVSRLGISLTVFAVSVFLLGYSLTPHASRRRGLFSGAAGIFVVVGLASAVAVAASPPRAPPEEAAQEYAEGRVAYDDEHYETAVEHLTRALDAWPEYARAHIVRARARFAAGSPQVNLALNLTSESALEGATEDLKEAAALGVEDSSLLLDYGYDELSLGLQHDDDALLERGLELSEEAREQRPTDPVPSYNIGLVELALGHLEEAHAAYEAAVRQTVFSDEKHHVLRDDKNELEAILSGALTDLQTLADHRDGAIEKEIEATKLRLIEPITRAAYASSIGGHQRRDVSAGGLHVEVGAAGGRLRIDRPVHFGVLSDVSLQVYAESPGHLGWHVLPELSGAPADVHMHRRGDGLVRSLPGLEATGRCLRPGRFRAELYVNGRFVARTAFTASFPRLVAGRLVGLGLSLCRPAAWRPLPGPAPGLLAGYAAPDGRAGTLVFRVVGAGRPSARLSAQVRDLVLDRFAARFPAPLVAQGARPPILGLLGADHEIVRAYHYRGGRAIVAAASLSDGGQTLVAVTFGPQRFMRRGGPAVLGSLSVES